MTLAEARGIETVVLSGGVFQNRLLLRADRSGARAPGACGCWSPSCSPPNDGGIAFGQAAVAASLPGAAP